MNPLTAVEASIGPLETWPAYIYIFLALPYSENIIKNIAAFMYGNEIELETAWKCYYACKVYTKKETIEEGMKEYFNMWSESPNVVQDVYYYNMRTKKFVWVNGDKHDEIKDVILPDWDCDGDCSE
jgi:phosphoribosyl-AMP cyclohydrolase